MIDTLATFAEKIKEEASKVEPSYLKGDVVLYLANGQELTLDHKNK